MWKITFQLIVFTAIARDPARPKEFPLAFSIAIPFACPSTFASFRETPAPFGGGLCNVPRMNRPGAGRAARPTKTRRVSGTGGESGRRALLSRGQKGEEARREREYIPLGWSSGRLAGRRGITRCNGNQAQPLTADWYIRTIGRWKPLS